jgi:hypothetical protein
MLCLYHNKWVDLHAHNFEQVYHAFRQLKIGASHVSLNVVVG